MRNSAVKAALQTAPPRALRGIALMSPAGEWPCASALASSSSFDDTGGGSTRTLVRGLAILDCFGPNSSRLTLQQIAQLTGLPKATAFRLVHTLEATGWLVHSGPQEYALSGKFATRAAVQVDGLNLRDTARPIMRELAERSGHSVTLHTLAGDRRVWLEAIASAPILRAIHYSDQPVPLCLGGATLVLLASMPPLELQAILGSAAESAQCPPEELQAIIETTRRQGYAVSHGGGAAGITGIAAPIFTGRHGGLLCITVVLPTPAAKGQVAELVALTQDAAQRISQLLTA